MEAMGQLTGGVAHDFNNLLTPIIGSLDMLVRRGLGSERERRLIDGALQSAERAKTLVQRLLAFARRQPLQPQPVDLRRLVTGMADLISSTSGPNIDVHVDLPEGLPPATADANQVEMALLNLAVNARDAMPDGGLLTISAARATVSGEERTSLRRGHYVRLSVTDTGTGMDEATLARAIEPFFSTKGIGKGTGLGLSMVHGLARQLNGDLTIRSGPGEGTSVELWLPISAALADGDERRPDLPAATKGLGTALLVDDEELVRLTTADMLIDLGYEVAEAASAEEALRLLDEGLQPSLLVTDHLMPGMNGAELARLVGSRRPGLPVLIVSGYAEADGVAPGLARLTKPFRNSELASSLAALTATDGA
jgi:CheY-like chemotaxis protein